MKKSELIKLKCQKFGSAVRATFWMYFSTLFLFMILVIAAYIVLLIPIGILGSHFAGSDFFWNAFLYVRNYILFFRGGPCIYHPHL